MRKNLKMFVYQGAIVLLIAASLFSSNKKKTANGTPAKGTPPQPFVQDNTANNVADLQNQLAAEKLKQQQDQQMAAALAAAQTLAQQQATAMYAANGQPTTPPPQSYQQGQTQQSGQPQLSPEQQQLAGKERELAFASRFASNLAYSHKEQGPQPEAPTSSPQMMQASVTNPYSTAISGEQNSSLTAARIAGDPPAQAIPAAPTKAKRPPEVNVNSSVGQPYVIFEGAVLDTVLMNRLDGDAVGPVKVLVSNPLYSHDHQHVLIPDGTIVLGEAKKIGSAGFGQQRRMAVVFHRIIMPDGLSVDLDQFHGLDQIGEEGLKDKVNNHYLQIFGTSIALGVIAGASQIESGGGTITTSGSQAFTNSAAGSVSQLPQPSLTGSCRYRRPSRFVKVIESRSISRRTCLCLPIPTTPYPELLGGIMRPVRYAVLALATLTLAGCTDKKCQPGDSATTCQALTQCFAGGNSSKACRQIERDQAEYEQNFQKNIAPALTGAGAALNYDPNKATQKPSAKPQPQPPTKK